MQATLEATEKELQQAKRLFHMPPVRTRSHMNIKFCSFQDGCLLTRFLCIPLEAEARLSCHLHLCCHPSPAKVERLLPQGVPLLA